MKDPRNEQLARIFVEHSTDVQPGDKVVISTSDLLPVDLIREVYRQCLEKGAQVYLDIMGGNFLLGRSSYGGLFETYIKHSSIEQLANPSEIYEKIYSWGEKYIRITTLDNYSHAANLEKKKMEANATAYHPIFRKMIDNSDWVLTYYPTEAMAQQAGMSMEELEDFYFGAVLVDYEKMKREGEAVQELVDNANTVRIVGERTDLTIDITGRLFENSCGMRNIPDGEVFCAPVHLNTEGHIYYDLPFSKTGGEIGGAYLEFENGKVVKATAEVGEDVLLSGLDIDEGARYLGELGIGLNYGIQKPMRNTIFDEKIGGTVHVTLGEAYAMERGGYTGKDRNVSAIHWDLVKDMRKPGSYIEIDGEKKFEEGKWLV